MSGDTTGFDDEDLRDPALRRALDHAPDHAAMPDPRTRDAIRKMAHNLAATPLSAATPAANSARAAPWWRRLWGGGEPRARMPWNAAFATVLVAAFVTVLWHREPVPDARLDGEARVGGAAAPAEAQAPSPVQAPPQAQSPSADAAVPPPPAAAAPAPEPAAAPAHDASKERRERTVEAPRRSVPPPVAQPKAAPEVLSKPQAPPPSLPQPAPLTQSAPPAPAATGALPLPAPAPSFAPAPVAPAVSAAPAPAITAPPTAMAPAREQDQASAKSSRNAYAAPVPPAPGTAPPDIVADRSAPGLAAQGSGGAQASGELRPQTPSRGAVAAKLAAKPPADAASFAALDRWTQLSVARAGVDVRHARADIEGLPALLSAAARSATTPGAELAAPVEARVELHRGTSLLAVLEIAGDQVRWTPQPGGTASVGAPPPRVLDALRSLLAR